MKRFILISIAVSSLLLCSISCGNGEKRFDPDDRTTVNMADKDKKQALEKMRKSFIVDIDSMMNSDNIKMSVLPPQSEILNAQQTELLAVKMLQMLALNGIGGVNNVPGFALTASIHPISEKATGSTPQKFLSEYEINYSVINTVTGDVYATASQKITGVGSSQEQAANNALNEIKPTPEITAMLGSASEKIIHWFDENLSSFKGQVSQAEARSDYALALALIQSVPRQSKEAYEFAESKRAEIENQFMLKIANDELIALKKAIVESDSEPSAEVYAHYAMILPSSPAYSEASAAFKKYEADIEAKKEAVSAERKANLEAEREMQMELARMENSRIKAKYQAQASEQAIRLYLSQNSSTRGFWSNLGARIIGAIDGTNWQFRVDDKPYTED